MSKKCRAYSESKLGLEPPDNRKAFYAGWDAALRDALATVPSDYPYSHQPVAWMIYTLDGKSVCVTDNPEDFTDQHRALPLYTRHGVSDER